MINAINSFLYATIRLFFGTLALAFSCFVLGVVARVLVKAAMLGYNLL